MNINDILSQTGATEAISRQLGIDPSVAQAGAAVLLPAILSGLKNPVAAAQATEEPSAFPGLGSLGGLLGTISSLGGGQLVDNVVGDEPTQVDKGNQILGQIFGSKDGSRAVAASAAAQSGVEPSLLKKMLPILAMLAAGYVMKRAGEGGGLGDLLGRTAPTTRGAADTAQPSRPATPDILGDLIGVAGKYLGR